MIEISAYHATLQGAGIYRLPDPGYLRLSGADRVDFLQRQTTNDIRLLDPTHALTSVLTSPTARILDVLTLLEEGDQIGLLTLSGRSDNTASFLRGRIFFNDDVRLDDLSAEFDQVIIYGPTASDTLASLGMPPPGEGEVSRGSFDGISIAVIGVRGAGEPENHILIPKDFTENAISALKSAGASQISEEIFWLLRIEDGIPSARGELNEAFTPLEVGLQEAAISLTKGCYTGQEIIARQVNYDKVTRRLVGLRLSAPVDPGVQVRADGKPAGQITSIASSPRFGVIALAVLKRPYDQAGTHVNVEDVQAEVIELPFTTE